MSLQQAICRSQQLWDSSALLLALKPTAEAIKAIAEIAKNRVNMVILQFIEMWFGDADASTAGAAVVGGGPKEFVVQKKPPRDL